MSTSMIYLFVYLFFWTTPVISSYCLVLQLAMVKNQRLAEKLIKGNIYDCVCRYEPAR